MAHAVGAGPDDQGGGRRVAVSTVTSKPLDGLNVVFEGALHTQHSLLNEKDNLQRWFPVEEDLVGSTPLPVGTGGRPVETTGRPDGGGKPQAVVIGVHVGDGAQVNVWVGEDVAVRCMAAFKSTPDSALHDPDLYGRVRSGELPTNSVSIAELGELPTGELAAAVHAKTSWSPHEVNVGQEMLDVILMVPDFAGIPYVRCHREALSTNMVM